MRIPREIVAAVNALLKPYGQEFDPVQAEQKYMTYKEAAAYTRLSKQTLQKAVRDGKLPKPFCPTGGRTSIVLFLKSDIDAFITGKC